MEIQSQSPTQPLSPFFSIWVKPRETIRGIVDTNPSKYVIPLTLVAGIGQALNRLSSQSAGDTISLTSILIMGILLGPIGGIVSLYLGGALYSWVGNKLGGQASSQEVRTAIAWSFVPFIFVMPLWIPELLIFGEELFTSSTPRMDANPFLIILLLGFILLESIAGFWSFIVLLKTLGEVHRFSAWKALGTIILGSLIIIIPILCIVLIPLGLSAI